MDGSCNFKYFISYFAPSIHKEIKDYALYVHRKGSQLGAVIIYNRTRHTCAEEILDFKFNKPPIGKISIFHEITQKLHILT